MSPPGVPRTDDPQRDRGLAYAAISLTRPAGRPVAVLAKTRCRWVSTVASPMPSASAVSGTPPTSCGPMGVSHLAQPRPWVEFFTARRAIGRPGPVTNSFINSTSGIVIVSLHQVWSGPAVVLTLFGWLLPAKSAMSLLRPEIGLRALSLSRHGDQAFRAAEIGLLVIGGACALQLAGIGVPS